MRAALLESPGDKLVVVDDVDIAPPRAGEVQVRITHCGLCHSDVHVIDGSVPAGLPVVCGHEPAGIVEEVGAGVTHVRAGDKVVLTARPTCGHCRMCVNGQPQLCEHATELMTGLREDLTTPLSRAGA